MAHLITFRTARFDVRAEDPNPINPIPGQGLLRWLRAELVKAGSTVTEPDTEDWGWYVDVAADGARYLVGASADPDGSTPDIEWTIQVHKHRSLKDRLLGRNTLTDDDVLVARLEQIFRAAPQISDLSIERGD